MPKCNASIETVEHDHDDGQMDTKKHKCDIEMAGHTGAHISDKNLHWHEGEHGSRPSVNV